MTVRGTLPSRNEDSIMAKTTRGILGMLGSLAWVTAIPAGASVTSAAASAAATSTFRDVATSLCLDSNTNGNAYTLG